MEKEVLGYKGQFKKHAERFIPLLLCKSKCEHNQECNTPRQILTLQKAMQIYKNLQISDSILLIHLLS